MPPTRFSLHEERSTRPGTLLADVPNNLVAGEPAPAWMRRLGFCGGAFASPWLFVFGNHVPRGCFWQV